MTRRILGWLLSRANADAPGVGRAEFYALKARLLARFGTPDGEDVQHIRDGCWGCDGTGVYADSGRECRRCYGSGVYREAWVLLPRWTLGGYRFHTVSPRPVPHPRPTPTVVGRVRHARGSGPAATEAALWLALAFDRRLFRRLMRGWKHCSWSWLPLVNVQKLCWAVMRLGDRLRRRTCHACGRGFRHGLGPTGWLVCRSCRSAVKADLDLDDVPF